MPIAINAFQSQQLSIPQPAAPTRNASAVIEAAPAIAASSYLSSGGLNVVI